LNYGQTERSQDLRPEYATKMQNFFPEFIFYIISIVLQDIKYLNLSETSVTRASQSWLSGSISLFLKIFDTLSNSRINKRIKPEFANIKEIRWRCEFCSQDQLKKTKLFDFTETIYKILIRKYYSTNNGILLGKLNSIDDFKCHGVPTVVLMTAKNTQFN